jgi:subfamily B ATP-binding cassette protein HlyB/CyaB
LTDGAFVVIGRFANDQILIQDPRCDAPQLLTADDFAARWSRELLLVTRRSVLPGLSGKFDLS